MKYQCIKGHIFIHPAKYTISQTTNVNPAALNETRSITNIMEKHLCPFCESYVLSDYQEPEPDIISVKSVSLEEVDGWLLQGYVVRELYAKTATLVKTEVKAKNPDPDDNEVFMEQAKQAYNKIPEKAQP